MIFFTTDPNNLHCFSIQTLIRTCYNEERIIVVSTRQEEDKAVFFLELLIKVVIQNRFVAFSKILNLIPTMRDCNHESIFCRDRISSVWPLVCNHLQALLMAASAAEQQFLIERCVIGLLRLAIRLMRRDEISSNVSDHQYFSFLSMLPAFTLFCSHSGLTIFANVVIAETQRALFGQPSDFLWFVRIIENWSC